MKTLRSYRILWSISALIVACFLLSGCPEFKSIDQPSSISVGEIFTVFIEAITSPIEDEVPVSPYFGICLPKDWTIPGNAITCTGVYNEVITYDPNLALEQEALSPSPEGYYWWVGDGNEAYVVGLVYGEIKIQTGGQLGLFSIDYMLGNSIDGLNLHRSDNHLIYIVDEYTPRGLRSSIHGNSVLLSWIIPDISEGLIGYNVYRDGQFIDTIPDENTEYTVDDLTGGVFWYSVSAVYEDGREYLTPYEVKGLVFSGGTGEPNDPYQIASAEQLVSITDFPTITEASFILINDIDLDPNLMGQAAFGQPVILRFSGTFDGNGFVISNLTLTGFEHLGLIGTIEEGGLVQNLGVIDANITGNGDCIGIIAGSNNGTVSNSYNTGTVSGRDSVGGLMGINDGTITSSYSTAAVKGDDEIGGLVGRNGLGSVTSCYSTGSVIGEENIGGLVGYNNEGSITSCHSTGLVSGNTTVGGLAGWNRRGTVTLCYSTGSVTGELLVGGLAGISNGSIADSYSTGSVLGNKKVGGLVGSNGGNITNCYSTDMVNGEITIGGLVGSNGGNITMSTSSSEVIGGYSDWSNGVGGLVGYNYGIITASYSTGSITGGGSVGGLVGMNGSRSSPRFTYGTIINCYSNGTVSGNDYTGGLVGIYFEGDINGSFWDIETSGLTNMCGFSYGGDDSFGRTTAEMQMAGTFLDAGWDFIGETINGTENIWWMDEGVDYPRLWWELIENE